MSYTEKIKKGFERYREVMQKRPSAGQETMVITAKMNDGLSCDIVSGDWKFTADLPEAVGGNGKGASPGTYSRFALGSCLAIGYTMWAAHLSIPIDKIEVEVQADADDSQLFDVSDDVPHYSEFRYVVRVESSASEEEILELLDRVDAHSPILAVFREPQNLKRIVQITQPES